jgi:catechol 2,3-dioxygenase-like lactoylglutathione lyase family enzyme
MLGRFLEVSIHAPDVPESLAFYESLGFVQAPVGDTWRHPYAVVTDGRLHLGLHAYAFDSPALTWVHPGLVQHAPRLQALGIDLAFARLGEDALHELGFLDPSGQMLAVLEARTFSPPSLPATHASQLGYFEEFGIPTPDRARATAFWDALGFVAFDPESAPVAKVVAAGRDLNVGLYAPDLPRPVLTFSDPQMPQTIVALRERGYRFAARLPRGLDARECALLEAPEGTQILLTTSLEPA